MRSSTIDNDKEKAKEMKLLPFLSLFGRVCE